MASVLPFLPSGSFDAEATASLGKAFDNACKALRDRGRSNSIRETIAKRIIEIAGRGERDPVNMCETALISLGLKPNRFTIRPRKTSTRTGKSSRQARA